MTCNPARWLWGLFPVMALIALAFQNTSGPIQQDLQERTRQELTRRGLAWAATGFDGRDGALTGTAEDAGAKGRADNVARAVWGVRSLRDETRLLAAAETFTFQAVRDARSIRLLGHVPNEQSRDRIRTLAKSAFPDVEIIDAMQPARGAPPQGVWLDGIAFGFRQLARLENGAQVDLVETEMRVRGRARSTTDFQRVRGELESGLPGGFKLAENQVKPPFIGRYRWQIALVPGTVTTSGFVPDASVRERIGKAISRVRPQAAIEDKTELGSGAPDAFQALAIGLVNAVGPLSEATITLDGRRVRVVGRAVREETALAVRDAMGKLMPEGFELTSNIAFDAPAIPVASPFETAIVLSEDSIRATGVVPDADLRQSIVTRLSQSLPGRNIDMALKLARGETDGWQSCMEAGLLGLEALKTGRLVLKDDTLVVEGRIEDERRLRTLPQEVRAAANRACRTSVSVQLAAPPEPDLSWRAERTGEDGVKISGEVPDSETRTAIVQKARATFAGAKIEDAMRVRPGRSAKWRAVALGGIDLLARLRSGSVAIENQRLTVEGVAPDSVAITAIQQRLAAVLPKGYVGRDNLEVKSAAMLWAEQAAREKAKLEAERKRKAAKAAARQRKIDAAAAAERLRLEELAKRRARQARERDAKSSADDGQDRAGNTVNRQSEAARNQAQSRKDPAPSNDDSAPLRPQNLERPIDSQPTDQPRGGLASRPSGGAPRRNVQTANARPDIPPPSRKPKTRSAIPSKSGGSNGDAQTCQSALDAAARRGRINFATASTRLRATSRPVLQRLAQVAKACRTVVIDIEGHTDATGSARLNMDLSLRRARAIVNYLTRAGVPATRLNAQGYGERRPIVPNTTRANRALNRRIEFRVRLSG